MSRRATLSPSIFYEDPARAMAFLEAAFGFETTMKVTDAEGRIGHAELVLDDAVVMLGPAGWIGWAKSPRQIGGANTQCVHIQVANVDAHSARAQAAGARIEQPPTDQFYGDRNYRAQDPQGHEWCFAQHVKDVAAEDMHP